MRGLGLVNVPVIFARGWSSEKVRAYGAIDNELAETSACDTDLLQAELAELIVPATSGSALSIASAFGDAADAAACSASLGLCCQ